MDDKVLSNYQKVSVQQASSCKRNPTDLASLHPLLQKAERGIQSVVRIIKMISQIITQEEISLLTSEWTLSGASDPRELVSRYGSDRYLYLHIDHYYKMVKVSLCLAHGIAEVERSLSTNKKLSTTNILCCQMSQTSKDAVGDTGHSQALAMPITQSSIQACRSVYSVYNTQRTREEKEKKAKEQRLDNRKPRCLWRGRRRC